MLLFFLRSLVKGQDHSFFKNLTGVFCTGGGTLVHLYRGTARLFGRCMRLSDLILLNDVFVCLFIVLRYVQELFTYMETSSLPVKGCKI
jgi:hypothetical protein